MPDVHNVFFAMDDEGQEEADLGVVETYSLLWKIIRLPLMPVMCPKR